MSWIKCRCGEILHDNRDNIAYKGLILSDKEYIPLLDFVDELIESDSPNRKALAQKFWDNFGSDYIQYRLVYQCYNCGRLLVEGENGEFFFFTPEEHNNTGLLDFEVGEKS